MPKKQMDIQTYLRSLRWGETSFSSEQLETILMDRLLDYFAGDVTLDFVLDLAKAIQSQRDTQLGETLKTAIKKLLFLDKQLQNAGEDIVSPHERGEIVGSVLEMFIPKVNRLAMGGQE